jgi:DNA-binding LytR/AlgR family response regulator
VPVCNRYQQGEADAQQKSCKLPIHRQSQKFATHLLLADPQKNKIKMVKDFGSQRDKKLVLKEKGKTHLVELDNITHITCEGSITKIHTIKNEDIIISKLLKYFEIELAEYGFIRVNHNTIINMSKIVSIQSGKKRSVTLGNGIEVNISRRKMYNFRKKITKRI